MQHVNLKHWGILLLKNRRMVDFWSRYPDAPGVFHSPQSVVPHKAFWTCTASKSPNTTWLQGEKHWENAFKLAIIWLASTDWVMSAFPSTEYKSEAAYNHLLRVKSSAHIFGKSFHPTYPLERASCFSKGHVEAAGGQMGSPGHSAHCGARPIPTAREMLCLTDLGEQGPWGPELPSWGCF